MQIIYKRLVILGLLSMCFVFFSYTDASENVSAMTAPCTQDCEANLGRCTDSCSTSCNSDSNDTACNSCITACYDRYFSCLSVAVSCNKAVSYTPGCQTYNADHCPIIAGVADCNSSDAHSGYYQICNRLGGQQCVACPGNEYCIGSNGLGACF